MKRFNEKLQNFVCNQAYAILCYFFLFLSLISFLGSVPYADTVLGQTAYGIILFSSFLCILFRKDLPKYILLMPAFLFAINTWLCGFVYQGKDPVYIVFLICKAMVATLILYMSVRIVSGKGKVSKWSLTKGVPVYVFIFSTAAEAFFRMNLMSKAGAQIDFFGIVNRAISEAVFVFFLLYFLLPKDLKLNRKKFVNLIELTLMASVAMVITIGAYSVMVNDMPDYRIFLALIVPGTWEMAFITHVISTLFKKSKPVSIEDIDELFYPEEKEKLAKRFFEVMDKLTRNEKEITELKKDAEERNQKQLADCLFELSELKYELGHCLLEYDDLDEIETEIEKTVYIGKRGI